MNLNSLVQTRITRSNNVTIMTRGAKITFVCVEERSCASTEQAAEEEEEEEEKENEQRV